MASRINHSTSAASSDADDRVPADAGGDADV
jgi:hypothetical protein